MSEEIEELQKTLGQVTEQLRRANAANSELRRQIDAERMMKKDAIEQVAKLTERIHRVERHFQSPEIRTLTVDLNHLFFCSNQEDREKLLLRILCDGLEAMLRNASGADLVQSEIARRLAK